MWLKSMGFQSFHFSLSNRLYWSLWCPAPGVK
jgi:hypothetical protein